MRVVSEGPVKLTKAGKTGVDAAWRRRAEGVRLVLRDAECRGLALVVNPTGMTWRFDYRPRGTDPATGRRWPTASVTLGNPATHSPDDARIEANRIKGQAKAGRDPAAEKRAEAEAARRQRAATCARLLDEYAQALPNRPKLRGAGLPSAKHAAGEAARARAAVGEMEAGEKPVAQLTPADVRRMLDASAAQPATARARFGALSRFLDWCVDAGHLGTNTCALVAKQRRPKAPPARHHYLVPADLAKLWRAAEGLSHPVWRDLARFLIAVPCRRGEAARLRWEHLHLAAAEWHHPEKKTKNGDPHRLHLTPLALDVLRARKEAMGDAKAAGLVFPSPEAGKKVDTFSDMHKALVSASGMDGWRWHDFRRSFATALGEAGVDEAVVDAVLNHRQAATRGGVLGTYQRAKRWPEQLRAMQAWGTLLAAALTAPPDGA